MLEVNDGMCFQEERFELEIESIPLIPAEGLLDTSTHVLQIPGGFKSHHEESVDSRIVLDSSR